MTRTSVESLQSLCLNIIVCSFDKYCALLTVKSKISELYLEFIQKRYGKQILEKLCQRKLLKNEHLFIVINKYTRELDFRDLSTCDTEVIGKQLKEVGHVISKVSMVGLKYYNYDVLWKYLYNVEVIDLQYSVCTNKSIISISDSCTCLKVLNVFGCVRITDKSIIYLSQKKLPLETIIVEKTGASYKSVALLLLNIPTIKEIWFANLPRAISEAIGVNTNGRITEDRKFNLTNIIFINHPGRPHAYLDSMIEMCHSVCPFIKDLTVTDIITEKQLSQCCLFRNLEFVNLHCSSVSEHELSIDNFLKSCGRKISSLTLTSFSLSLETLANSCLNLKYLTLENLCLHSSNTDAKDYNFPHLKVLTFNSSNLDAACAQLISSSPNIEELYLHICLNTEEVIQAILSKPKKLKILSFNGTCVDISYIFEILKVHSNLKELSIKNSHVLPSEYDDLMDFVDELEKDISINWADYTQAIRELYNSDPDYLYRKPQVLKL